MAASAEDETGIDSLFPGRVFTFFLVVLILAAGFLGWVYWKRFGEIFALQAELTELKEEREELKEEVSSLEEEVARRNDPDYMEELAKEELGMVYPPDEEDESD